MNRNTAPLRLVAGMAIVFVVLGPTFAQSTAPTPQKPGEVEVTLAPFTVSAEAESGYQSNETLSATRLRGKTRDVASALTVITQEMLNDLGVTTFNELADFIPSSSNYHINEGDSNGNGPRTGTPFYVRGFRSDSITANFFSTGTPIDTYNTSRVTFARGPNSILFGIGRPGGSVDNPTNRADPSHNFGSISFRTDNFGSMRETIDYNIVSVPKKLAFRVDLLDGNNRNNIKPNRYQNDSAFLTGTYKLSESTTVTANFQATRIRAQIPKGYPIFDWYSPWAAAGNPLIATARASAVPGTRIMQKANTPLAIMIPGVGLMNWAGMAEGARPNIGPPAASHQDVSFDQHGFKVVPLDVNTMGDADKVEFDTKLVSVFATQRLAKGLYLELAAQTEHVVNMDQEPDGNTYAVYVDPNVQLPNGVPNPNVGLPYLEFTPSRNWVFSTYEHLRATLSYERDFSSIKVFGRGLGSLTMAALYQNSTVHGYTDNYRMMSLVPGANLNNAAYRLRWRQYLTPPYGNYLKSPLAPLSENGIETQWLSTNTPRNDWNRTQSLVFASQFVLLDDFLAITGGIRRDEQTRQGVDYTRSARGIYELAPDGNWPSRNGTKGPLSQGVGRPYLYGAVLNLTKNFSLFGNKATNYAAGVPSTRDIYNNYIPAQTGRGTDVGMKFFFLDGRISGSFDYFQTETNNGTIGNGGPNGFSDKKAQYINSIWAVLNPNNTPPSWSDLQSQKTHGIEFQVVGNPTKNLRLMGNLSRNITTVTSLNSIVNGYVAQNAPTWLASGSTAANDPTAGVTTVASLVDRIQTELLNDQQMVGIKQTQTYIWQANLIARYQFDRSALLKGFAIGTASRWRSAPAIGFPSIAYPSVILDVRHPFYGSESVNVDGWVEYNRNFEMKGHKIGWMVQLRAGNIFADHATPRWTAYDNGSGGAAVGRRLAPRDRQLTIDTKFTF